ncbi:precorrin-6y C5,15-methyltransferase (decarboxylating) subunit CbiE [Rhizohabitans arisaemae]|uniref:precorrin-6y C5,15-methyltransferase (decarboxylating) subunit CbiE n=1 Tax=Rhizohabitans arisaemae TaxID=2720610 RepID=UPI0024B11669|nr:precorrin-6y C5,15-methyltransferase (decarboxylating) subunit CbiE [Rhizohabitans arisaemae]
MSEPIRVVGVGADGWDGLSPSARREIGEAEVLMGGARQLDLVPDTGAERVVWPSPMLPALPALLAEHDGRRICVLASGDPMFFGVGTVLARLVGPERIIVLPHPSSISLACARLGWAVERTEVVSLVGRAIEPMYPLIQPNRRILVLSAGGDSPAEVAARLTDRGYGASALTLLERLGGPGERVRRASARDWPVARADPLNVVAVECRADPGTAVLPRVPGLPDDAFEHDGQLTKREVRAVTLSRLAPVPGELLWDVGAGAGSVAIEWMRTHPACRAIGVESRPDRADRVRRNAAALGVPGLSVVVGAAPAALAGLDRPDAVFVGGGATVPGLIEACLAALRPGGRLVVNAVTVESEAVVAGWYARRGGDLLRLSVQRAAPVGAFTGWRAMMPVTVWTLTKETG